MPLSYKLITALLAVTGCVSIVITGEINPLFVIPVIALVPGYYRFFKGEEHAPRWVIGTLSLIAAGVVAFDTLMVSGDFFVAVAHMTISFQAIKSFDLKEPWDHLQVYFMSLLQLIMASELAISVSVGGMFVLFLFVFVVAIVFSHFMKEGTQGEISVKKPVVIISIIAFVVTAVLFVTVPRAKGSIWQRKTAHSIKSVGFSGKVDFGSFGDVLEDSSVVMMVSVTGPSLPLYWRGTTLDYFDGVSWKDSLKRKNRIVKSGGKFHIPHRGAKQTETVQKIFLEPIDTDVVFGLGEITAIESGGWFLERDVAGSLYLQVKSDRRFSYTAYSVPEGASEARERYSAYYLQLPPRMERISALARQVSGGSASAKQSAVAIEDYLETKYSYSLKTSPPPEGMTPIEDFLFNSRTGYCEHFATSMVLMLRSLGIPSRMVTGFSGGETNSAGDYIIVRQRDAHSWVEAAVDGKWMLFDPTPPAPKDKKPAVALLFESIKMKWYRYVVGFDFVDQRSIFAFITAPIATLPDFTGVRLSIRPVYIVLLVIVLMPLAVSFLVRRWPRRRPFETRAYLNFRKAVKKRGGNLGPSSTPEEVVREAVRLSMDAGAVAEFAKLYEEIRFGGTRLDREGRKKYAKLAQAALSGK